MHATGDMDAGLNQNITRLEASEGLAGSITRVVARLFDEHPEVRRRVLCLIIVLADRESVRSMLRNNPDMAEGLRTMRMTQYW